MWKPKQHKFVLQFWKSEVQNGCHWAGIKVWAGMFLLETQGNPSSCPFQLLEAACISWLVPPFQAQSQQGPDKFSHWITLTHYFLPLSIPLTGILLITAGPLRQSRVISLSQGQLISSPVPFATSTPPCQVTEHIHRLWWLECGHLQGIIILHTAVTFNQLTTSSEPAFPHLR